MTPFDSESLIETVKQVEKDELTRQRDEAVLLLGLIVNDLPTQRNWLDPAVEQQALAFLKRITSPRMVGGMPEADWQRFERAHLESGTGVDR